MTKKRQKPRMVRFGGPRLSPKQSTWYETTRDGRHVQVRANHGDVVPESAIMRWTSNGPEPAAEYYIAAGMASYCNLKQETTEAPASPDLD